MLKLKVTQGPALDGKDFQLDSEKSFILGRSRDCELRLPSLSVSKKHCRLTVLPGGRAEIEDLGSSNGTFVNGVLVNKKILKPGDSLGISDFVLKLGLEAPAIFNPEDALSENELDDSHEGIPLQTRNNKNKAQQWLESNLFPWLDTLSEKLDLRMLCLITLGLWLILTIAISIGPLLPAANSKIENASIEVARLYARQLARVNQNAIVEERYRDLVSRIDARPGQTPGVIRSFIFDAQKGRILSPAENAGNSLPHSYAAKSIQENSEWFEFNKEENIAFVSAPIWIGTANDGNIVAATAFVEFIPTEKKFQLSQVMEQFVISMIWVLIISLIFILFLFHWIDSGVAYVARSFNKTLQGRDTEVKAPPSHWPNLLQIVEHANVSINRGDGGGGNSADSKDDSWAIACCENHSVASASFDDELIVRAWNENMEALMGIRAQYAIGADLSGASRDKGFESTLRELAEQAQAQAWTPFIVQTEVSGSPFALFLVYGMGTYLLQLSPMEEEE